MSLTSRRVMAGVGPVLVTVCLLLWPAHVLGQGNIELGPFRILPTLELIGEYNDNILLAPRNEVSDFIFTISPGLSIELPGRRYAARVGYRADILRFLDETTLDTVYHTVQGDFRIEFPGGLGFTVSDEFRRTADFAGFPVPDLAARVDRQENDLKAGASYVIRERFTVAVDYRLLTLDYRDAPQFDELDREDQVIGVTVFMRVLPKTSVLAEYDYQIIRYDLEAVARDRDSDSHMFKVGLRGDVTAKTSVLLKAGFEDKDYESPAREDWTGVIVQVEVIYKYREPSQIRLFGARQNVESTFEGTNFFIATYGGLEVRHYFTPKVIARLVGLVGVNDYQELATVGGVTQERSDDFYEVRAGLLYQIRRWLGLEIAYAYLVRDSNFDDFDYTNNRVQASIRFTF